MNTNKQLDLTEILKDHIRETFYLTIEGDVILEEIKDPDATKYPIILCSKAHEHSCLTRDGRYLYRYEDAECILFPSKNEKDWNAWYEKQKQQKQQKLTLKFKPFDRVLVRDRPSDNYMPALFSCYSKNKEYPYMVIGERYYKECIPYNKGLLTKSL